jgi:succinate dehydrogenase / fumarate reductase membrane anchor subunit
MSLRTPLSRVLGHGSAGEGTGHWWMQRVTSVALIPLTLWFVVGLAGRHAGMYIEMRDWLSQPWQAVLAILLIVCVAWHSRLGVQVVIEDYVHGKGAKTTLLLLSTFVHFASAVAAVFAVLLLARLPT